MNRRFPLRRVADLVFVLALGALPATVRAQSDICDQLRQEIAVAAHGDDGRAEQYARAAQRQRGEIARTQAYADQIGCSHGFSIFGGDPPQCDAMQAQLDRMRANYEALTQQVEATRSAGGADQLAALQDQYRASCNPQAGDGGVADIMRPNPDDAQESGGSRRYGKAVCVRTCDGGFFPLSFSPAQRDDAGLQAMCSALCPNTEVKVFTTPDYDNISAAVSLDGSSYKDLPNALRFQKTFDAACACKPPNKSWVETLAAAEQLLDKSNTKDVTVTAKMSDEMARPVAVAAPGTAPPTTATASKKASKKSFNKAAIKALLDAQAGGTAPPPPP